MTNHAYWNLSGSFDSNIYSHLLHINASSFVEGIFYFYFLYLLNLFFYIKTVDKELIPTGNLKPLDNILGFQTPSKIGENINKIESIGGYDHCYCLNDYMNPGFYFIF